MEALQFLFGTSVGLMSVFTITATTVIVVYMYCFISRKIKEDEAASKK